MRGIFVVVDWRDGLCDRLRPTSKPYASMAHSNLPIALNRNLLEIDERQCVAAMVSIPFECILRELYQPRVGREMRCVRPT